MADKTERARPYYHVRKEDVHAGSARDENPAFASFDVVLRRDYDSLAAELAAAEERNEELERLAEELADALIIQRRMSSDTGERTTLAELIAEFAADSTGDK